MTFTFPLRRKVGKETGIMVAVSMCQGWTKCFHSITYWVLRTALQVGTIFLIIDEESVPPTDLVMWSVRSLIAHPYTLTSLLWHMPLPLPLPLFFIWQMPTSSSKSPHCETFSGLPTRDTTGKKQLIHMNSTIYCVVSQYIKQASVTTKLETREREVGMGE